MGALVQLLQVEKKIVIMNPQQHFNICPQCSQQH
jgi:hypothetical protein